jgi:uncharacterized membrane protein YebE (DUF533 family)
VGESDAGSGNDAAGRGGSAMGEPHLSLPLKVGGNMRRVAALVLLLGTAACSDLSQSQERVGTATVGGAAGGALIGAIAGNAGLGAGIGAGVGLIGGLVYDKMQKDKDKAYQSGYSAAQQQQQQPKQKKPKPATTQTKTPD